MAFYNPNVPDVVGNEWVAIVPAPYTMDSGTERGYQFTSVAGETPTFGQFFLEAVPANNVIVQYPLLALYPAGQEDEVGEIKTVVVPVNSASVTGTTSPSTSAGIVEALASPASDGAVDVSVTNPTAMDLTFDLASVNAELMNKRILNVSIVYTASGNWVDVPTGGATSAVRYVPSADNAFYGSGRLEASGTIFSEDITEISRISLGEMNPFAVGGFAAANGQIYPWRNQELQRFNPGGATPMRWTIRTAVDPTAFNLSINYLAMEITYCTENRLRFGSSVVGSIDASATAPDTDYMVGNNVNSVVMRTTTTFVTGGALTVGNYSLTSCVADPGDRSFTFFVTVFAEAGGKPTAQALRELYPLTNSTLRGIELDRASRVGERFDVEESRVLPYLALSDAYNGASVASSHAYGQRVSAPVFAGSTPTQSWIASSVDATPYPWIRFWARRFTEDCTGVPALTVTVGSGTASIGCADFLALPEIADGWRQVTLRFGSPPVIGTSGTVTWSSPAVTGSQWQVLVESGSSISNGNANYGTAFASPSYPPVGFRSNEDAAFYMVQDPPTVTGVTATLSTSALSPIFLDCGTPGACVPTGMSAVALGWTSIDVSAPSATGTFGYYEVQRQDDVDSTWQTIATLFTTGSTGFPDREARVGVASRYRVRVVTDYGITGPFSSTVTATIPATHPSAWLFTSSWDLFGVYSFAAIEVGDTQPALNLSYYEGTSVTYQEMYGRNNRVGFHGTERGGEAFTVTLLTNQGMASPNSAMGPRFANFRTLAWNKIDATYTWTNPYVCVRNGEGDRWYGSVEIPTSRFDRRLPKGNHIEHLNVNVIEELDLPVPIDLGTAP
jgi:hypothetical protein